MLIETLQLGLWAANCYIYSPDGTRAVVIDPGADGALVAAHMAALELECIAIINTHGHLDHIGGNRELQRLTGALIAVGAGDAAYLGPNAEPIHRQDALIIGPEAVSIFQTSYEPSPGADFLLKDGDIAPGGLRVLATPGHTAGGVTLAAPGALFVGDTIFAGSVARWDLCGGDRDRLLASIRAKILTRPGDTTIYPGHGPKTTVEEERRHNPFFI